MPIFHELTTVQLRQAVQMREQIESLQVKLAAVLGESSTTKAKRKAGRPRGKRTMSDAGRARISAAQKARWAKINGTSSTKASLKKAASAKVSPKKKGGLTPEGKLRISAAMKARWAAKKNAVAASSE